jgi:hypothetical protein
MGELRQSGDDVADGVNSRLGGLLPLIDRDESALGLDFGPLQADAFRAGAAAHRDEDFVSFFDDLFAVGGGVGDLDSRVGLLDLLELGPGVAVDAALPEGAGELFADLFVFDGDEARQIFDDGDLLKIEPNSTPTAPAPMTTIDFGISGIERISILVRMRSSAVRPGSSLASEPVASRTFFARRGSRLPSFSTSTVRMPSLAGPVSLP